MSKMKNLEYEELKMQDYLTSEDMPLRHKKLAFRLRTRMTKLSNNMGMKNLCFLCKEDGSEDGQAHVLFNCSVLKNECPQMRKVNTSYLDIFSEDSFKVGEAVKVAEVALRKRLEILDNKAL